MWALLSRARQVQIIVALTAVFILGMQGLNEWWSGEAVSLLKVISSVTFVIGTVLVAVANSTWRALWRWFPMLNRAFFPDLNGTWSGTLQTTWKDPQTGITPGPIAATVTIRQGLFDINIKLTTGESTSHSTRVIAESDPNADRYRLWYSYDNRPKAEVQFRSTQHEGICWLEISLADAPDRLAGQYFTSRRTNGDIEVTRQP